MKQSDILHFINEHPLFYLATSEDNIPRVRIMRACIADKRGIFFNTKKNKESYRQLQKNPYIEMCFFDSHREIQIRISGKAEIIDEKNIKEEIVNKFSILQALVETDGYDIIAPVVLKQGVAKIWTRTRNCYEVPIN